MRLRKSFPSSFKRNEKKSGKRVFWYRVGNHPVKKKKRKKKAWINSIGLRLCTKILLSERDEEEEGLRGELAKNNTPPHNEMLPENRHGYQRCEGGSGGT